MTVNCLAPNARTRLTEQTFGEMQAPQDGFDAMHPANISPIVVALASEQAGSITGQTFFVYGGIVSVLKPWDIGTVIQKESRWEPNEFLARLTDAFPAGVAPEGMMPMMVKATQGAGVQLG